MIYFPDAGAMKRYEETVHWALDRVGCKAYIIHGDKKRDWKTGKILGLMSPVILPRAAKC